MFLNTLLETHSTNLRCSDRCRYNDFATFCNFPAMRTVGNHPRSALVLQGCSCDYRVPEVNHVSVGRGAAQRLLPLSAAQPYFLRRNRTTPRCGSHPSSTSQPAPSQLLHCTCSPSASVPHHARCLVALAAVVLRGSLRCRAVQTLATGAPSTASLRRDCRASLGGRKDLPAVGQIIRHLPVQSKTPETVAASMGSSPAADTKRVATAVS